MRTAPRTTKPQTIALVALLAATFLAAGASATLVADPLADLPEGSYVMDDGRIAVPLRGEAPSWYTPEVHAKVLDASELGLAYDFEQGVAVPLSLSQLFIRPGAEMIFPSGCTMNFIYGRPGSYSIGSAGHCNGAGEEVVIVAAPTLLAAIGKTKTSKDGGVGSDYSLTPVYKQFQQYVDPNVAVVGGPQGGEYTGSASLTSPVPLKHFGHGLVVGTAGTPRVGVSWEMDSRTVYFNSPSAPGDSGSPVLVAGTAANPLGQAVGVLTHLIIDTRHLPNHVAGTRVTAVSGDVVDGDVNPLP